MFVNAQTAYDGYCYFLALPISEYLTAAMSQLNPRPVRGAVMDRLLRCEIDVGAKLIDIETRRSGLNSRRGLHKRPTIPPGNELSIAALVLNVVEQRLRDSQSENASLRASNERLRSALVQASLHGVEARRLALHDWLTGLPNRMWLREQLQSAIAAAGRQRRQLALLFIDLDGFKIVNDEFGHASGDKLLKAAATRIKACVRADDIACRYGGDEFVVLLSDVGDAAIAARTAAKIRRSIRQRYSIEGKEFRIAASIGLALYPRDGEDCDALLSCADASMYRSKISNRSRSKDCDAAT
jgi:diguanylate cyclase